MSSATAARGDAATDDRQTLVQLNENYIRSVQESDVRWFEAHLSADFLNSNPDGSLVDLQGFLAQIAKPAVIRGLRCEDVRVRLADREIVGRFEALDEAGGLVLRLPDGGATTIAAGDVFMPAPSAAGAVG